MVGDFFGTTVSYRTIAEGYDQVLYGMDRVGEAYSDQQGWAEGAFCTAERMLQDHFGLEWPSSWLDPDYYLGW